jgi:glycosyltransferase involved in cell wall biosynthesis
MRVTIVAANSLEYDSRLRRTATALVEDGHDVTLVGFLRDGLPAAEELPGGIHARRIPLDLRLTSAFRPLPRVARAALARILGFDSNATTLPPSRARGLDRLRAPIRRLVEILAHVRRGGPWSDAVLRVAPGTDVFHAKALIALPVIRRAARRSGARFVYDIADIHVEAARLARLPRVVRWLIAGREARWMREAAGLTAVSDAVADEVVRRYGVPRPTILLNAPPPHEPENPSVPADTGRLRDAAGLPPGRQIVLYQGGLSIDRGIEELIAAIDVPPLRDRDVAIVVLGYGRLEDVVRAEAARRPGRVVALDAVPTTELMSYTTGASVSYVGQPPRTLNQRLNLANKLFESIMVGVPVVVAEGTEHARVVAAEDLGRAADLDRPESIGAAIAAFLDEPAEARAARRQRLRTLALEKYSWTTARAGVVELYRTIADARDRPTPR